MNILLINSKGPGGGGAHQAFQLACALKEQGCQVTFSSRPHPAWDRQCAEKGLPFLPLPYKSIGDIGTARKLIAFTRENAIDILQVQKGKEFALSLPACYLRPQMGFVVYRGVSFALDVFNKQKYMLKRVDRIVGVADSVCAQLTAAGVPESKVRTIYGGVDPRKFIANPDRKAAIVEEFGIGDASPIIGMVAHFRTWKRHEDLIQAASLLRGEFPHLRLLLVGRLDNEAYPVVHAMERSLGLDGHVIYTDERHDVPDLMQLFDVSINCADSGEGLTGALRESMLMRAPVVTTAVAGNTEVIRHEETGLVVPPRNPEELAKAIARLLTEKDLAAKCVENAYALANERLTLDSQVKAYLGLYEEILAARKAH